jgi:glycosyltransferase involved in cell wall biosynthesis
MSKIGWLVNDCLTCIPGTTTFWHNLLEWFPELIDKTNGYTDYSILSSSIEQQLLSQNNPYYIIRNGSYFRPINTIAKQISLIQDCTPSLFNQQIDVMNNSDIVIFNTNYVYNKYKNRINNNVSIKVCPLGVDFDFFKPTDESHPDVLPNSLIFIGSSSNYPKGFNVLQEIISKMKTQNFCLVMKDDYNISQINENHRSRVRIFNRVNKETVRCLINSCIAAICTSYEETQHLSGIECAACNIPIIAREVGVYYDNRDDLRWGCIAQDGNFLEKIQHVLENINTFQPRQCFIEKYSTEICKKNWKKIIEEFA